MVRLRSLVLLALAAVMAGAGHAAPTISKLEVRRLPQAVATHRVLDQAMVFLSTVKSTTRDEKSRRRSILDLLRTVAADSTIVSDADAAAATSTEIRGALDRLAKITTFRPDPMMRRHPRYSLREYSLFTVPHASPLAGLCVLDTVTVLFDPVGKERGPRTRVRASEVVIEHDYHLLVPPENPIAAKSTDAQRRENDRACAALVWPRDLLSQAPTDADAIEIAWLAQTVIAQARKKTGIPGFGLDCSATDIGKDATKCLAAIARLAPVAYSGSCEPAVLDARTCNVRTGSNVLDIQIKADDPTAILRVALHDNIVIADDRAD